MSEVFEVKIITKNLISYKKLCCFILSTNIKISSINYVDNWDYENQKMISLNELREKFDCLIEERKILIIEANQKNSTCGFFIYKNTTNLYNIDFWIPKETFTPSIVNKKEKVYDKIVEVLKDYIGLENLFVCGIGVEILMDDETDDLVQIIEDSANVFSWILPIKKLNLRRSFNVHYVDKMQIISFHN